MDSHSNAAPVLTPALLKMSHVPYSANSVNSQPTPVHTVQHQKLPVTTVNTTTPNTHIVNSQPPPNLVHTTTSSHQQPVQINTPPTHQSPPDNLTTQQLFNMLQPLLIHQHSTLTTINALLTPHLQQPGPPTPAIIKTITTLLQDCPKARHLLPTAPSRPTRHREVPNYCELDPRHQPLPRPNVTFPLGNTEGVGVGPSTLNAPGTDAGSGLFGITPKKAIYTRHPRYHNLFAKAGDFICTYTGTQRTRQDCISHPSMYLFSEKSV